MIEGERKALKIFTQDLYELVPAPDAESFKRYKRCAIGLMIDPPSAAWGN